MADVKVPAAAAQPHEIEQQKKIRLLQQVRETRSSMLSQLASIEGRDPAKHYSWINSAEPRVTHFRAQGYEICRDEYFRLPRAPAVPRRPNQSLRSPQWRCGRPEA